MADVNIAISERRPIVQDPLLGSRAGGLDQIVKPRLLPFLQQDPARSERGWACMAKEVCGRLRVSL